MMTKKTAVIIGAGPAGLTAAYELLDRTDVVPIVLEASDYIGGISRTVLYKGNRLDIGPHRFFSKSDRVMDWWLQRIPLQKLPEGTTTAACQRQSATAALQANAPDPATDDHVMLVCRRKTRIYFLRQFFDYPLRLSVDTITKLGLPRMMRMGLSYGRAALFANKNPKNLEDFFISRFGRELYLTFFKSYTEKVWGTSCSKISAEWGAQRVKGLSIGKAIGHFLKTLVKRKGSDLAQKKTETSLIEEFLFPKLGAGQMWETVAHEITRRGGQVIKLRQATKLHVEGDRVAAVDVVDAETGQSHTYPADYVFSTMPVQELVGAFNATVPDNVRQVADGLVYRDSITVGLILKKLLVHEKNGKQFRPISDNWIYIQESDVKSGRMQIFNNWGPGLVADPTTTVVGLEFFCDSSDGLWERSDQEMSELAKTELAKIGIIDTTDVLDSTVLRMPKTYPAYFGSHDRFDEIRTFVDGFSNLFLIGRNGMHKYNNLDHSMLTAMTAVDNIAAGKTDKSNIWDVNTEQDYHETRSESSS